MIDWRLQNYWTYRNSTRISHLRLVSVTFEDAVDKSGYSGPLFPTFHLWQLSWRGYQQFRVAAPSDIKPEVVLHWQCVGMTSVSIYSCQQNTFYWALRPLSCPDIFWTGCDCYCYHLTVCRCPIRLKSCVVDTTMVLLQAVEIRICCTRPVDEDVEWTDRVNTPYQLFQSYRSSR